LQLFQWARIFDPLSDPLSDPFSDRRDWTYWTVLRRENCKGVNFMPVPKAESYTFADVLTWDEQDHIELIDGQPVMMAPPVRIHQKISGELYAQLHEYLRGKKCEVYAAPFAVRLFERDSDRPENVDTMVEPDISIICDPRKLDHIGCKGAPDLIIEILSPSTLSHDRVTKFNLYQRAGVKEYWIVDPAAQTAQSFILENGYYIAKELGTTKDKLRVNILSDCTIDLSLVFSE